LVNDKTRLAQWMEERGFSWSQLQPAVLQEFGSWAKDVKEFSDLSLQQAKAIYNGRADIENVIVGQGQPN
jgi:hypothetical protein